MPSRWWVPLHNCRPPVKLEHVHAVVSGWLDTDETHRAHNKGFSLSPVGEGPGGTLGFQIGLSNDSAADQLLDRLALRTPVRLGDQRAWCSAPKLLQHESWDHLLSRQGQRRWQLSFQTPVVFRTGNRSTPLPNIPALLRGLMDRWNAFSPVRIELTRPQFDEVWVEDLDLTTDTIRLDGRIYRGSIGTLGLRCHDSAVAAQVAPLLGLATYAGVGSFRSKGFGVSTLKPLAAAGSRST